MKYFLSFILPFIVSFALTPVMRLVSLRLQIVAAPRPDRWHKEPMPLLGGASIFIASLFAILIFVPIDRNITGFLISAAFIFVVGLIDDIFKLVPQAKLLGQIFVSCIAVIFGIVFGGLSENLFLLSIILTVVWIVGIINSFNLLDNMDGLSCGVASICSFVLFMLSFGANDSSLIPLIICGAALGFLPYNFNPAKIFMGDSGSMFIGFCLGSLAVMGSSRHTSNLFIMLLIPVLILVVPIFDTMLVMLLRTIRGRKISAGGKDHTSHRLVALGLTERKTVLLLYLFSAIFGLLALSYSKLNLVFFVILAFLFAGVLLYFGMFLSEADKDSKKDAIKTVENNSKKDKVVLNTIIMHKRRIIEIIADFIFIVAAYYLAYFLRFEGDIGKSNISLISRSLPWIIPVKLISFYFFGLYRGVWKYIGIHDLISITKAVTTSSVLVVIILTFFERFQAYSRVVFIIDWLLLLLFVAGSRIFMRLLIEYFYSINKAEKNILIVGAGDKGEMLLREIVRNKNFRYNPVGFIDDNMRKVGSRIHGLTVLGTKNDIPRLMDIFKIEKVFIAIPTKSEESIKDIIEICNKSEVECQIIHGMLDIQ